MTQGTRYNWTHWGSRDSWLRASCLGSHSAFLFSSSSSPGQGSRRETLGRQSPKGGGCERRRHVVQHRHTCARLADHGLPGGWLTLEDLLGHIGDARHLATSGPQLSLKLQVVRDPQRLGLFLVVKIAAPTAFQRWGDRRVDGGPGSLIRGLQGEGKKNRSQFSEQRHRGRHAHRHCG